MLGATSLLSQNETLNQADTPSFELRDFNKQKLTDYRSDSAFDYEAYRKVEKGAFERFVDQVKNWFLRLFSSDTTGKLLTYGFYLLCFIALLFFIIKLFGIEVNSMFKPSPKPSQSFEVSEESLNQIDFEGEIQKAENSKQWRVAVRLIYLEALKHLADNGFIDVKKGKTNQDYLYEISIPAIVESFSDMIQLYEYTWYGHFEANEAMTRDAKSYSQQIQKVAKAA